MCVIWCINVWDMSMGCLFVACLRQGIIMSPRMTLNLWWASCLSLPNARFINIHPISTIFIASVARWITKENVATGPFGSQWKTEDRQWKDLKWPVWADLSLLASSFQHLDSTVYCRFLSFASQLCLRKGLYFHCYRLKKLHGTLDNKNPCCQETPNCWIYS